MRAKRRHPQGRQSPGASIASNSQSSAYQVEETPVERVVSALESVRSEVRATKSGFSANCPCPGHDDQRPSLKVSEGDDGRALVHCHGGCSIDDVLAALGLDMHDLYPENQIEAIYRYADEAGDVLYEVVRLRPKGFYVRRPDGNGGWREDLEDTRRVLYRLPEVIEAVGRERIWVVEGEKDVDALVEKGEVATCNPGGAGKWLAEFTEVLRGADVLVVRDDDKQGRQHGRSVARRLSGIANSVTLLRPAEGCHDTFEHLDSGHRLEKFVELKLSGLSVVDGPEPAGDAAKEATKSSKPKTPAGKRPKSKAPATKSQKSADLLIMASELCETFRWEDQVYASWPVDGHRETWSIKSREFKGWLSHGYWNKHHVVVGATAISDALRIIETMAQSSGRTREVHTRLALGQNGAVYVDLLDDDWRAIKITPEKWTVVKHPAVRFVRRPGMLPLPEPIRGGSLEELRHFVNATDDGFILIVAWLIGAYCPWGPYAILDLQGEQGSAKTTTAEILRRLIDPNVAALRVMPNNLRDLAISARNSWLLTYDNVSHLKPDLSDALCRLSTGAAFVTRALYTDDEEVFFSACRPILMNGIEELGTRPDLLDRTILVSLPTIDDENRRESRSIWQEFEEMAPRLLGAVLDAVVLALAGYKEQEGLLLERMADFAAWTTAASEAFGGPEALQRAIKENSERTAALILESNPVVSAILELLADEENEEGSWEGNADHLLKELNLLISFRSDRYGTPPGWPRGPRGLGGLLHRLAPALRAEGMEVDFREHGRIWTFRLLSRGGSAS